MGCNPSLPWGPWTSGTGITWELVRNADSQPPAPRPPGSTESESVLEQDSPVIRTHITV